MKNPLGLFDTQEGPLAVVLLLKVLYFLKPPDLSRFSTEDLTFCAGQAQTVLLPYDFFLVGVCGKNRRGHHNYIGILQHWSLTESLAVFVVRSFQLSLFSDSTGAATISPCRSSMPLK